MLTFLSWHDIITVTENRVGIERSVKMSADLSKILVEFVGLLLIAAPLTIQLILYPLARLCFKKVPAHVMYWLCFVVNTILLHMIKMSYLNSQDPAEMEAFDAFDGLVMTLIWAPWYIGVLIWAIAKSIIAAKSKKNKESDSIADDNVIDENLSS